ncbi:hypothetical protein PMAYCL1PPCAC_14852, partial [Pristionchus mayeri]
LIIGSIALLYIITYQLITYIELQVKINSMRRRLAYIAARKATNSQHLNEQEDDTTSQRCDIHA